MQPVTGQLPDRALGITGHEFLGHALPSRVAPLDGAERPCGGFFFEGTILDSALETLATDASIPDVSDDEATVACT